MTAPEVLEIATALALQVSLILPLTHWIGRRLASEQARCRLWTLSHGLILTLFLLAFTLPHFRPLHLERLAPGTISAESLLAGIYLARLLAAVWVAGVAISLGLFVYRTIQTARFVNTCRPAELELPGDADPTPGQPLLLTSPLLISPFCWQFHRPCIVLPEFLLSSPPEQLRSIVAHELAHLRQGHPLQLLLQRMVETLFWFLPLTWWSSRRCNEVREFVCDAAALRSPAEIPQYLRTLLEILETCQNAPSDRSPSLSFGRGQSVIQARIQRLLQIARGTPPVISRPWTARRASLTLLAAAGLLFLLVWPPVNPQASRRSHQSPWPAWSARCLHDLGVTLRDYEPYDPQLRLHELREHPPAP